MGQLEDIMKHQNMVRNNIMKSFGAETSEDSLEKSFEDEVNPFEMEAYKSELTKAELDEFEKAKHQDGDMHPNGKWVWRQSANGGKGDWRVAKPSRGGGRKATTGGAAATTTKTNTEAKTSSNTLSDKEKNAFVDIMKKNSSHKDAHMNLEQMSDDELRKFANAASLLAGDKTNLNDKTRANIKGWMKLAHDEQTARRNNKKTSNTVTHDINGTKVTVTKNSDGSYTLEANGKKVKSDDPSFFVNGTNLKPKVKVALAKEVGLETKRNNKKKEYSIYGDNGYMSKEFLSYLEKNKDVIWPRTDWSEYKNVKVHHYGSKDSNYVAITGTNKSGVSVQIDDGYITGEGTGGNHPVLRNATLKFLTEQYKKHGK